MADTRRTLADILTNLFQDGQSEGISAQDMRDLIVSLQCAHGDLYVASGDSAATAIGVAGTFVKGAGTTTFHDDAVDFDANSVDNRLRYIGETEVHAHITGQVSLTSLENNRVLTIGIYHYDASVGTGSVLYKGRASQKKGTGTDIVTIPIHCDLHMDTNDYIELWVTDEDGTNTITFSHLYMSVFTGLV